MGIGVGSSRRSQQIQRKEPRKIIPSMSLSDDVQLNKAEKAWKPSVKKSVRTRAPEEVDENDPESIKTFELFKSVRSILNKLTPQKFQQLMKQVMELNIDTEERLKGVIDLIFEKAISEPNFSVAYANMCRCLIGVSGAELGGIIYAVLWLFKHVVISSASSRYLGQDRNHCELP